MLNRNLEIRIYDTVKYDPASKEVGRVSYPESDVESWTVTNIPADEILKIWGEVDPCNEYLVLNFKNGETATYRNSYCDMFRI